MALVQGTLPYPNNMATQPGLPAPNHYLCHDHLADEMALHGANMRSQPKRGACMCCGVMPGHTLWQIEVQTHPDQKFYQIGIPRCQQILAAALRVRQRATVNPVLGARLTALEQGLGVFPLSDEIKRV